MRVLHIMAGAEVGGAEIAFLDLLRALHKRGVTQQAIIRTHEQRAGYLTTHGIPTYQAPFRKWFDWKTPRLIRQTVHAFQPDIVQTWMSRASTLTPNLDAVQVGWLGGYYNAKYYQRADYVVAVAPGILDDFRRQGWPADRMEVMRTFATVIDNTQPVDRMLYNTPEGAPLILGLGRLHYEKGFDVLLKALPKVPGAYVWLAGDGPERADLHQLAHDLGVQERVHFLGWRTDREALLKAADICVIPSRLEGFGTVMIEAWANRVPLIASASAGPREHIVHGDNGLLVPVDDVDTLSMALDMLIADQSLAAHLVARGWEDYQDHFTEEAVTQKYIEFYHRISAGI